MNVNSIAAIIRITLVVVFATSVSGGCYLLQSAQGHLALMSMREPISTVVDDARTPPALRKQLLFVTSIRDFASRELLLPDNGSYRSYADVGRAYVVWNVVAAPEFSVEPKQSCYPVVGCVAYRGYFVEKRARRYAASLRARGFDVVVGGVAAYSTLGHFDDPILSTMTAWDDVELAAIVFHELTHQLLYIANDASFNEALATTIEEEGVRRWLQQQGRDKDFAEHVLEQQHYVQVIDLLTATRGQLRDLYASGLAPREMRDKKMAALSAMRDAYVALKAQWGGHAPFDGWFSAEINNAHLASIATYYICVPGFQRELAAVGGDLPAFYRRVRMIAKMDPKERDALVCGSR